MLPSAEMLVDTQKGGVDKTSLIRCQLFSLSWLLILYCHSFSVSVSFLSRKVKLLSFVRLTVAYLKSREVVQKGELF